jgi:hypothetical protein
MRPLNPFNWIVFLIALPILTAPIWGTVLIIRSVLKARRKAKAELQARIMR